MLFQNFSISLEMWICAVISSVSPCSTGLCWGSGVCRGLWAPELQHLQQLLAAASGLRVSSLLLCQSDCPGSLKGNVFNHDSISPECCIQLVFAITVTGYNYPWFEFCRNCSWTISGRPWQDTVGAGNWLKVLPLLVLNCAKHLPTSTGKIILSFSC